MSIEDELLSQICANPADLAPRLVYADRLIERGDPRGTFIAQQCHLSGADPLDEDYPRLLASTRRLEATHARTWLGEYLTRTKIKAADHRRALLDELLHPVFENGFLRRIAMRPEDIKSQWSWLRAREPIEGIELLVSEHLPQEQRNLSEPAAFRVLKVSPESWFTANSAGNVLAWGMPDLRELDLSRCDLGLAGCQLLCNLETDLGRYFDDWKAPPPFARGQLERLVLGACQIGDEGARALFASEILSGLVELDLSQSRLQEPETLAALRDSPHFARLRRLSLSGSNGLEGHFAALAGFSGLAHLERLALPRVISLAELRTLFPTPASQLRELHVSSAKELLKEPAKVLEVAETLTHLDVGSTSFGDAGWLELLGAPSIARALDLRANGCSLSDAAIGALTRSKLRRLVTLDLSSNKLTDKGLTALAAWPGMEHVAHLRIGNNRKVTAAGYQELMDSPNFTPATLDIGKSSDKSLVARLRERFGEALLVST